MMEKRVYGVLGIVSKMANWNAEFSGYPKTTTSGDTYGSDKAFKYPMKKLWDTNGEKVLYIKSLKLSTNKGEVSLVPRSLKERYELLFSVDNLDKCKDAEVVLKNLFKCIDVKNFGATFAEKKINLSITGAVQFGQGLNKYRGTVPQEQDILSPFRDNSKDSAEKEAKNSTLGTKIVSDEAHYFYPFTVNPLAYKEYAALGVTDGYTERDYQAFKQTALCAATAFATNAKEGCDNEFGLFIETEATLYLPNLTEYIDFKKTEDKDVISLHLKEILSDVTEQIKSIEVYYNPITTKISADIDDISFFNIVSQKEVR